MSTSALNIDGRSLRDWLSDPLLRRVVLLAELDAFLHDLDKASVDFVLANSEHKGKKTASLELDAKYRANLNRAEISTDMQSQFAASNLVLGDDVYVKIVNNDQLWEIRDSQENCHYKINYAGKKVKINQAFRRGCSHCPQPFNEAYSHSEEY